MKNYNRLQMLFTWGFIERRWTLHLGHKTKDWIGLSSGWRTKQDMEIK